MRGVEYTLVVDDPQERAATAVAAGLPVYTFNPDDFRGISGLTVLPLP